MAQHIGAQLGFRGLDVALALRRLQGIEGLQRKLRVDHQTQRRIRKADQAIRPGIVAEHALEGIGAGVQAIAHDRLHAALPIGTTRLLVGQDVLQRHHFARQGGEVLLCRVDDRQTLVQLRQGLAGALGLVMQAGAETM